VVSGDVGHRGDITDDTKDAIGSGQAMRMKETLQVVHERHGARGENER